MNPSQLADIQLSLAAVGDLFMGELPDNTLDKAIPVLEEHDLRFCVFEGPVSDRGEPFPGKMSVHRSGRASIAPVKKAGFDIVTLAGMSVEG